MAAKKKLSSGAKSPLDLAAITPGLKAPGLLKKITFFCRLFRPAQRKERNRFRPSLLCLTLGSNSRTSASSTAG